MTTITVSSKYQIVIPKEARERMRITPGTLLQVQTDKQGIHLVREPSLEEIRDMLKGMQWEECEVRNETDRELP
jgi:AbrB family looped-hinge helix DNA binding protein